MEIWQKLARDNGGQLRDWKIFATLRITEKSIIQAIVIAPQSNYPIISYDEPNLRIAERKIYFIQINSPIVPDRSIEKNLQEREKKSNLTNRVRLSIYATRGWNSTSEKETSLSDLSRISILSMERKWFHDQSSKFFPRFKPPSIEIN